MEDCLVTSFGDAAERAFADYHFWCEVRGVDGWEYTTPITEMRRRVYLVDQENPAGPSIVKWFIVRFIPGTTIIVDSYLHN